MSRKFDVPGLVNDELGAGRAMTLGKHQVGGAGCLSLFLRKFDLLLSQQALLGSNQCYIPSFLFVVLEGFPAHPPPPPRFCSGYRS